MAINTVIIEDEEKSTYVLRELLRKTAPDVEVTGVAGHVEEAIRLIEDQEPQLVFLDIRIGDGLGFDVLKRLQKRAFELICITAYNSYALEAFRYSAIDYLLKPIGIKDLEESVDRVRQRLNGRQDLSGQPAEMISIPTSQGCDFIDPETIVWCLAQGSYTIFHLTDGSKHTATRNMGYYEELLCAGCFVRIHHNTIVNMRQIRSYVKGKGGYVILKNDTKLEVSQRRKTEFLEKMKA
ncbi:LytR/AlgR family response regulator transcription factor [Dinghuibacter silviterrae]|uniref:LytTR family two component transcriptional regulator n=1 Tax=Dinghuibacter silviterrae TaxID=1539049 RepID=A0A4R8DN26_9BACT|nr:LytTR family DNA-binding domain-containing protein [Dinghuibacter silviterrae]TDW99188.1 LytTR family two component transcriptional regulator [Dinghuibacter silviterrae]